VANNDGKKEHYTFLKGLGSCDGLKDIEKLTRRHVPFDKDVHSSKDALERTLAAAIAAQGVVSEAYKAKFGDHANAKVKEDMTKSFMNAIGCAEGKAKVHTVFGAFLRILKAKAGEHVPADQLPFTDDIPDNEAGAPSAASNASGQGAA